MHIFFVETDGRMDGPHDAVTIMRRIRAGKITRDTLIYMDASLIPMQAASIPEIALFFETQATVANTNPMPTLGALITDGWQFVQEHTILSMFSGVILLVSIMAASILTDKFGVLPGSIVAWVFFMLLNNIFLVFALRSYREQTQGGEFIRTHIVPVICNLVLLSVMLALMTAGGMLMLIIPGIAVMLAYIFAPFLIYDRRYGVIASMYASRLLMQKNNRRYVPLIASLVFLHLLCLILILPIPVTLPIYAAALSRIYEEILA